MREIKFRAWTDRNGGEMIPSEKLVIWNDCVYCNDSMELKGKIKGFSVTRIMQLTGLKDKNGVEMYEGDIVEIIIYSNNKIISTTKEVVIFQDSCFGFIFGNRREFQVFRNFCNTTFEVIGNIYQNPDLCK